jgi:hypothetical protein
MMGENNPVTKSDLRVLGGFFTGAGAVWALFLPREYTIGPSSVPQWWIGIAVAAFGMYILLYKNK